MHLHLLSIELIEKSCKNYAGYATAYILFAIKEAFAIVLWFLFCILLYYIIFAKNMFQSTTYYEKKL